MTTTLQPTTTGFQERAGQRRAINGIRNSALPILIAAVYVGASIFVPQFLTFETIRAILLATSITGIIAVGMTAVTLSGNFFSLAVTASTVFSGVIYLWVGSATGNIFVAALAAIVVALVLGLIQGYIVGLGLNPVVVTLAAGAIIYGSTAILTKGEVVAAADNSMGAFATFAIFGVPLPVFIFIGFTAVAWFLTEHTLIGRNLHLLGANKATARNSGISATGTTIWAFLAFSVGIGVAAILQVSQTLQIQADNFPELTMNVVAAVLVGGTAITGGDGSPVKSAIGALFIATITQIMVLSGIPQGTRYFVLGLVVVALVITLHLLRKASR
ncbi:ABC transporter permease [Subtercola sp. PAMC28395]|uniref:ABC transporter permease n=1 Tax=Subtercola sp. PAMC28395 TaxID=2846775 RepID=UPI001C0CECA1|nr:ABC transporter permease [Subtercola sp. PAMC28395]QWT24416.1 ABC transporter permease [Subtercola sp. PAMC28395]